MLNELFADELDLGVSPSSMFNLAFEAVLDDETPTCFPRAPGMTLQSDYELFEFVPGEYLSLSARVRASALHSWACSEE